jgi:hypothetical protein
MTHYFPPPRLSLDAYPSDAGDVSNVPYQGAGTYLSTGSDVALRSDPVIPDPNNPGSQLWQSNVIEYVGKGDVLDGTDKRQDGFAWVTHRVTGQSGWMSEKYLTPQSVGDNVLALPSVGVPPAVDMMVPPPVENADVQTEEDEGSGSGLAVGIGLLVLVVVGYGLAK